MDKNKKKGFTLVELIVVLAILAILAAMLVPALTGYIDKANEKKVIATARQYYVAAQTVASEAYANGDEIEVISLRVETPGGPRKFSLVLSETDAKEYDENDVYNDAYQDGDSKQLSYIRDFIKLVEESKDVLVFYIGVDKGTVKSLVLNFSNKAVNYEDGEFKVLSW